MSNDIAYLRGESLNFRPFIYKENQMENNMFGLKDIYDCTLKATYDMKLGNRVIKAGEPIVVFESLSLANFDEFKKLI